MHFSISQNIARVRMEIKILTVKNTVKWYDQKLCQYLSPVSMFPIGIFTLYDHFCPATTIFTHTSYAHTFCPESSPRNWGTCFKWRN